MSEFIVDRSRYVKIAHVLMHYGTPNQFFYGVAPGTSSTPMK